MILIFLLLLPGVRVEEATSSNLLAPRNFNHHPFKAVQFLKKTSKKGPILFPNDGPPPDPTPLIVTSRPLIESIRRSDLNVNNSIQAQSQVNPVFATKLLARLKEYKPFVYNPVDNRGYQENPYAEVSKKNQRNIGYDNYEQLTSLPIYKALSDHANKVLRSHRKPVHEYQVSSPDYVTSYKNNDAREVNSNEYDHGENYAFSYKVKDQKTGDDFSHSQSSSGSATNGEYRVRLPDGRMQIVSYTADENGYKADVRYDDHNIPTNEYERETNRNNLHENNLHENNLHENNLHENNLHENNRHENNLHENNRHENSYYNIDNQNYNQNNQYRNDLSNVLTSVADDKPHIEYLDNNNGIRIGGQEHNDNYSDYLLTDNENIDQYNHNNITVPYINTFNEKSQDNDYYHYTDDITSKEYKDYSNEFDYQPHKSKYASFIESSTKPSYKPSYEELKNIFVKKLFDNPRYKLVSTTLNPIDTSRLNSNLVSSTVSPNFYSNRLNVPVSTINPEFDVNRLNTPLVSSTIRPNFYSRQLNIPVSTLSPNFDSTTENIVIIGAKKPNLFTNIRNNAHFNTISPSPLTYSTPVPPSGPSPSTYLISTITNLKNQISLSNKPELSNKYIDKINKYLSFM